MSGMNATLLGMGTAFSATLMGSIFGGVILRLIYTNVSGQTEHLVAHIAEITEVHLLPVLRDAARDRQAAAESVAREAQAQVAQMRSATDAAGVRATAQARSMMAAVAQQLAVAAGANRFSGRSGQTNRCIALDLSGDEPRYVPINATVFSSAGTSLNNESADEHKLRSARLLHEATDGAPRFTASQLEGMFRGLDVAPIEVQAKARQGTNSEGVLLFSFDGQSTLIASGWEDAEGNVNSAALIDAPMLARVADHSFDDYRRQLISRLVDMRNTLRPDRVPTSVPVLHFATAGADLVVGNARYTTGQFRQIVGAFEQGGIILQYDPAAGETCPDRVVRDVLTRTGYTNAVPDPAELRRLRRALDQPTPGPGMLPAMPHVRLATAADLPAIHDIYNHYVVHSTCTYQTEVEPLEVRAAWFAGRGIEHPVTVTVAEVDGRVVGWGALSRFHSRAAYGRTVENAVYVRHDCHRRGVGRAVLADLVGRATALGHHTIIALVDGEQAGSLALHERLGFEPAGRLRQAGFKFGRWLDVVYLQLLLAEQT